MTKENMNCREFLYTHTARVVGGIPIGENESHRTFYSHQHRSKVNTTIRIKALSPVFGFYHWVDMDLCYWESDWLNEISINTEELEVDEEE